MFGCFRSYIESLDVPLALWKLDLLLLDDQVGAEDTAGNLSAVLAVADMSSALLSKEVVIVNLDGHGLAKTGAFHCVRFSSGFVLRLKVVLGFYVARGFVASFSYYYVATKKLRSVVRFTEDVKQIESRTRKHVTFCSHLGLLELIRAIIACDCGVQFRDSIFSRSRVGCHLFPKGLNQTCCHQKATASEKEVPYDSGP